MRFRATLRLEGKTATGVQVPPEIVESLGPSKRPPVRVTLNGYTYRSSVAPMGGVYMLGVSDEVRKAAGVAAGDELDIDIELDIEPREVTVPPDFSEVLDSDAAAKQFFAGLSYSNKRRFVMGIEEAKTPETRRRRIDKALTMLREGRV